MITLKTLHEATAQQVFDQVTTHLRKQGRKSLNETGACCYRHTDKDGEASKCAAGCLIADDEYDAERMEKKNWSYRNGWVPTDHEELIKDLQVLHDTRIVEDWEDQFEHIAARHNLNYTIQDEQ